MRFTLVLAIAVMLTPVASMARPAGLQVQPATDLSAAKKHHKKPKPQKAKEEYLKAAPGTGPSGPSTK